MIEAACALISKDMFKQLSYQKKLLVSSMLRYNTDSVKDIGFVPER